MTPKSVKDFFASFAPGTTHEELTEAVGHLSEVDVDEFAEVALRHGLEAEVEALATFYASLVRHMKFQRN